MKDKMNYLLTQEYLTFIDLVGRVFANDSVDRGSIPSHTKDSKMVLDTSLLNTQYYKVHIKGKPRKEVAPFPTPRCSSD